MYSSLRVVTPPAVEPISLTDAKLHLRVDQTSDDGLIGELLTAARFWAETYLSRVLITQTLLWTVAQHAPAGALPLMPVPLLVLPIVLSSPVVFNQPLEMPRSPVQSVSSVTVTDRLGNVIALTSGTDYTVDLNTDPGRLRLHWCSTPAHYQDVQVQFVAGYGADGTGVPPTILTAIKVLLAFLYENRGDAGGDVPQAVEYLLAPFRIKYFG